MPHMTVLRIRAIALPLRRRRALLALIIAIIVVAAIMVVAGIDYGPNASGQPMQGARDPQPSIPVQIEGRVLTENQRGAFETIVGVAQIFATLGALGGLLFLAMQVAAAKNHIATAKDQITIAKDQIAESRKEAAESRREARGARTRAFQERYSSREFRTEASLTVGFLNASDAADCIRKIEAWESRSDAEDPCLPRTPHSKKARKASVNDVQQTMGFFEDFGTAYMNGDLEEDIVAKSFSVPPVQVFTWGWWFLCWRRGGRLLGETGMYAQFEGMVKSLRDDDPELKQDPDLYPKESVRVLCLPKAVDQESRVPPAFWGRSRSLSVALTRHSASLEAVLHGLEANRPGWTSTARERWRILLIPPDINVEPDDHWERKRKHAKRLAVYLDHLDRKGIDSAIEVIQRIGSNPAESVESRPAKGVGGRT